VLSRLPDQYRVSPLRQAALDRAASNPASKAA
jgi:hypothetical protein